MNLMLDNKLIRKLTKLFASIELDDLGNLTINKNLDVGSNIKIKGPAYLIDQNGDRIAKPLYVHDIVMTINSTNYYLSIYNESHTPIKNMTDIKTICGRRTRVQCTGGNAASFNPQTLELTNRDSTVADLSTAVVGDQISKVL